jgi:regulatory protein
MAGVITALRVQKKNRERVNVYIDEQYAFAVGMNTALQLRKGQQLSDAEMAELRAAGEENKAYHQVLRYLGMRPRSTAEIRRYLAGKDYDPALIDHVIARVTDAGYLDDQAFADFWVENRMRFRPRSARALRHELREKGVEPAVIDRALAALDESDAAWDAVSGRLERWRNLDEREFAHKLIGYLSRRGFSYAVARATCDRAWAALQDEE